jgi:ABC-2 type transport system ATP-binding protein
VEEALTAAGLGDALDRRTGGFSRSMLQRLGLAATVVGEPSSCPGRALLGPGPGRPAEVLDLVKRPVPARPCFSPATSSRTCSICDTVGVLRQGRLLYQGPLELLVGHAVPAYLVACAAMFPASPPRCAGAVGHVRRMRGLDLRLHVTSMAEAEREMAARPALKAGRDIVPEAADLEDVFLELTK